MTDNTEIIDSYKIFLEVKYPNHFKNYCARLTAQPEGARAEAFMFSFLRQFLPEVKVAEDVSSGGVDFFCSADKTEFILEVTCLELNTVTSQSGLSNEKIIDGETIFFSMITHTLRSKVSRKVPQVSTQTVSRVLAITTEHIFGNALIGQHGAEFLLTSDTKISIPINNPITQTGLTTDLKDSVFFRINNGVFEVCRRSISAILLVQLLADKLAMVGLLHPDPIYPFPIKLLPTVPFLRLKRWPPEINKIQTEWVIYSPSTATFPYYPVKLKDQELRQI